MDYINNLLTNFLSRIGDIANMEGVNQELIEIFKNNLIAIETDIKATGQFGGLLNKIKTQREMLDQVKLLPQLKPKYEILREQSVVLMVGALEVFISDIFREIANHDPGYFVWLEKDKKISIGIESFTPTFTLGDAITAHLANKQFSFQDLKSILRATKDYLGVEFDVSDDIRKNIIFGTSCRHIIVHNISKVDRQFLLQTRELENLNYKEGDEIKLKNNDIENMKGAITGFADELVQLLKQRYEEFGKEKGES